jgi:dipeptide/tripeptide permease
LLKFTAASGVLMASLAAWRYGWRSGLGLAAGAVIAGLNLASLSRAVQGLAGRIVEAQSQERGGRMIWRFFERYVIVLVVSYVIFRGYPQAFPGFLVGLCTPVAALMVEAALGIAGMVRKQ